MTQQVMCVFSLGLQKENIAQFKSLITKIVAETQKEADTIAYAYHINPEENTVHIIEHYKNSAALVNHVDHTFGAFAEEFVSLISMDGLHVYGEPSAEAKSRLDGFNPVYMNKIVGF